MRLRLESEDYHALCHRVMSRDGWKCRKCGLRQNLHCHHIVYRSEQGPDESWNLMTTCSDCHDAIHRFEFYIEVVPPNFVGAGGGADGILRFTY
jgi:hypothetical protein